MFLMFFRFKKILVQVGSDTAGRDGDLSDELVQLLIISDYIFINEKFFLNAKTFIFLHNQSFFQFLKVLEGVKIT